MVRFWTTAPVRSCANIPQSFAAHVMDSPETVRDPPLRVPVKYVEPFLSGVQAVPVQSMFPVSR